jgi:hypothetical protein
MASYVRREDARFELRDGAPVIVLAVEVPTEVVAGPWSLLNRLTLIVVDGPGDVGFLMSRIDAGVDVTPPGWDDAVESAAGSHVVLGTGASAPAVFARNAG